MLSSYLLDFLYGISLKCFLPLPLSWRTWPLTHGRWEWHCSYVGVVTSPAIFIHRTWVCVWKVWLARQMYMYTEWSTWSCSFMDVMVVSLCIHTCVSFCLNIASLVNDSSGKRVSTNNLVGLMKEVRRYLHCIPLSHSLSCSLPHPFPPPSYDLANKSSSHVQRCSHQH